MLAFYIVDMTTDMGSPGRLFADFIMDVARSCNAYGYATGLLLRV